MDISTESFEKNYINRGFLVGLTLAISSSIFIGSSFIIKKLSLIRLTRNGNLRAGSGGFGYLNDWTWWLGLISMGLGELLNFAAYTFAPASLVTPLGSLSVLVSAILASKFLKESLNSLGKLGCLLCIIGSTIIIIYAPKETELKNLDELIIKLQDSHFLNYITMVFAIVVIIIMFLGPRYGARYVSVYIFLCSVIGSLTVTACKGLGLAIKELASDTPYDKSKAIWFAILLLSTTIVCICIQMTYLNRALDLFSTSIVTPVYYVMFTTCVLMVSAVLFDEFREMSFVDISGELCGFAVTVTAIFLVISCKENNFQPLLRN